MARLGNPNRRYEKFELFRRRLPQGQNNAINRFLSQSADNA
jgi:hypothetical protein